MWGFLFENSHFFPQTYFLGNDLKYYTIVANTENIYEFEQKVNSFFDNKIKFSHSGINASRIAFDKSLTKMAIKKTARKLVSSGQFDPEWYLAKYPDVSLSGMDPAQHYVMFGRYEGRASRPSGLL